jgi:tetratricopeptide (TPR) repeat protein
MHQPLSLKAIVIGLGFSIALAACSGGDSQTEVNAQSESDAIQQPEATSSFKEGDSEPHGKLSAVTLFEIGLRHMRENHPEAAIEHFDRALALEPSNARVHDARSSALFALGEMTKALAASEIAVELLEEDPGLHVNRGLIYIEFGRRKEALEDYARALELSPNYAPAFYNRGVLHFNLAENEKALQDFSSAINAQPELANPYFNRAMVQETLGNLDGAKADMLLFLERTASADNQDLAHTLLKRWSEGTVSEGAASESAPAHEAPTEEK